MKIAFTSLGCPDWTVEEVAIRAKQMGADGIELRAKALETHICTDTAPERVKEVRALFEEQGIPIIGITGYTQFFMKDEEERRANERQLVENMKLCQALGGKYVRTFIGYPDKDDDLDRVFAGISESLSRVSEMAKDIPVKALVETHDFASAGRSTQRMLEGMSINHGNVGAIWDISHPPKAGESPEETWEAIGKYVCSVHIKDEYQDRLPNGEIEQCYPEEGILPLRRVLEILDEQGYDGWYVVEWERAFNMNLAPLEEAFAVYRKYLLDFDASRK